MAKRKRHNPFILTGYEGPQYFCDREKELEWLVAQWANERNVVLHSWRRMGKTALIKHLFNHLEKKEKADCLYVDLLGASNTAHAVQKIAQAAIEKFGSLNKGLNATISKLLGFIGATVSFDRHSGMPQLEFSLANPPEPEHSLSAIGKFLAERNTKVLVAIDEFQQVTHFEGENAEAVFRSWSQEFSSIRFIFSGSHRHMMLSMFSEKNRPFYRSAQLFGLEAIPEAEYIKFIQSHFSQNNKSIEAGQVNRILQWARFQTYYTQLACSKVFERSEKVADADIEKAFSEIIAQEAPLFSNYRLLLTSIQWVVLRAIAKEGEVENPLSQSFIKKYRLGAASTVKSALTALEKKELLIYWNGKYCLHDTLLCRWLEEN
jgi:uncharacterized protein